MTDFTHLSIYTLLWKQFPWSHVKKKKGMLISALQKGSYCHNTEYGGKTGAVDQERNDECSRSEEGRKARSLWHLDTTVSRTSSLTRCRRGNKATRRKKSQMTSIFLGWATEWMVVPLAEKVSMRRRQNLVNDDGFSYGQGKSEILWGVETEKSTREKFKHSKENPGMENKFVSHHHIGNGWCKGGAGVPQGERVPKQVKRARTGTREHPHLRISHPVPNWRRTPARAARGKITKAVKAPTRCHQAIEQLQLSSQKSIINDQEGN